MKGYYNFAVLDNANLSNRLKFHRGFEQYKVVWNEIEDCHVYFAWQLPIAKANNCWPSTFEDSLVLTNVSWFKGLMDEKFDENGVEIEAKTEESKEEKGKNWLRKERSGVSFYRSLELPEELKTENVEAELKDGILTLNLPKVEPKPEYKAKKVQVK